MEYFFLGGGVSNLKLSQSGEITSLAFKCLLGMLVVPYIPNPSYLLCLEQVLRDYVYNTPV